MPPRARQTWTRTLGQLAAVLGGAVVVGLIVGYPWPVVTLAALGIVAWHYTRLHGVLSRLSAGSRVPPPQGEGVWNELDRQLHRSQSDVRARKRRLIAMLRAYRAAAMALPDAVVVIERNSQRVQWFNPAATTLLGLRYPRDAGAPLGERLHSMSLSRWLAAGRNAEPLQDTPSPVDATTRLSLRLIPYSEDLWLLVARDVTKLMRLEHMRRDFVANVSHELRTPLTVVHGYLDLLDPADQPEWAPMLAEMQRQSQRMTQLVEDLLTLSRLEAQDGVVDDPVSMASMLATLRREAEALSQGRHRVVVDDMTLARGTPLDLRGSTKELHSAFSNLVSNAVRYTPVGGTITVRFAPEADGAVLAVNDTGYGIPAAHLPRITERFYRVSTSRSRESGGTGLGLAIVKHVLNLHGARLSIDSEVGLGSTFAGHFPADRVLPRDPHDGFLAPAEAESTHAPSTQP
ncbi:phosphate regulon sensor histidine kinase PhoR [Lysobacter sp. 2RAF19]